MPVNSLSWSMLGLTLTAMLLSFSVEAKMTRSAVDISVLNSIQYDGNRLKITLKKVEDFRCPVGKGIDCRWRGQILASFDIEIEGQRKYTDLSVASVPGKDGQVVLTDMPTVLSISDQKSPYAVGLRYSLEVLQVAPPRSWDEMTQAPRKIREEEYRIKLKIAKDRIAADFKTIGEVGALASADKVFLKKWKQIRVDYEKFFFADLKPKDIRSKSEIDVRGQRLSLVPGYSETLLPNSRGALRVTFWKSSTGNYFIRISGGDISFQDRLFGPMM